MATFAKTENQGRDKEKKKILKEADGTTERQPETSCERAHCLTLSSFAGGFNWLTPTKTRHVNAMQPGM